MTDAVSEAAEYASLIADICKLTPFEHRDPRPLEIDPPK